MTMDQQPSRPDDKERIHELRTEGGIFWIFAGLTLLSDVIPVPNLWVHLGLTVILILLTVVGTRRVVQAKRIADRLYGKRLR